MSISFESEVQIERLWFVKFVITNVVMTIGIIVMNVMNVQHATDIMIIKKEIDMKDFDKRVENMRLNLIIKPNLKEFVKEESWKQRQCMSEYVSDLIEKERRQQNGK